MGALQNIHKNSALCLRIRVCVCVCVCACVCVCVLVHPIQTYNSCNDLGNSIIAGAASKERYLETTGSTDARGSRAGAQQLLQHKVQRLKEMSSLLEHLLAMKRAEYTAFSQCQGTQMALQNALQVRFCVRVSVVSSAFVCEFLCTLVSLCHV